MTKWHVLLVLCAACGGDSGLTDDQLAAVQDGLDSIDTDGTIVDQVEVTLSGNVDPTQAPDAAASASVLAAQARLSPGCITSTVEANVVTHVLSGCTGPRGRMLSGTIVSTWAPRARSAADS